MAGCVFDVRRSALNGLLARHWHHHRYHTQTAAKTIRQMSIALTLSLSLSPLFYLILLQFYSLLSLSFTPCVQFVPNQMGRRFDRFLLFFFFSLPPSHFAFIGAIDAPSALSSIPSDPNALAMAVWPPLCRESLVVCVFSISLLLFLLFLLRATIFAGWHAIQVLLLLLLLLQTCPPFSLPLSLSHLLARAHFCFHQQQQWLRLRRLLFTGDIFAGIVLCLQTAQHTAHCSVFLPDLTGWLCPPYTVSFSSFALFFVWVKARSDGDAVALSAIYRLSAGWQRRMQKQQKQQQHGSDLPDALFIFLL